MNESSAQVMTDNSAQAEPEVTAQESAPWYGQVDEDTQGYIGNKGWQGAQDVIHGYRNLEKLLGHDRAGRTITIPKEGEDASEFYKKLGRPEKPEDYRIEAEGELADWFKSQAFDLGLSQDQASKLIANWDQHIGSLTESEETDLNAKYENEWSELKKDWGSAYDSNINAAKRAASKFGFEPEEIDAMEKALGPRKLFHRMSDIGRALAEDSFETGDRETNFKFSPAEAKQRISDLKLDKQFMEQYMSGNKDAIAKMQSLMQAAYPE